MKQKQNLKKLFEATRTIAIVGLSDNPARTSNRIARYLQNEAGYRIIPVNPRIDEVLGEKAYPSLTAVPEDIKIDIVNVFRRCEYLPEIAEESITRGCGFFWAQLGVKNSEAAEILDKAEIPYIMDACIFVEHRSCFF